MFGVCEKYAGDNMNAIQEIKDEAIRKVAQTLRTSGLASSDTEAVRMAVMMTKTSQRVTQNFDQKKQGATMGAHTAHVEEKHEEIRPMMNAFGSSRVVHSANPVHVQEPFSVQEPSKTEEKEEFIFGDVQEDKTAQRKDPYRVENEFEEVINQEIIGTKPKIQTPSIHRAFGQPSASSSVQERQAPVHNTPSIPVQRPITAASAPMSAQGSAQMAFASLLGSANQTQIHHQTAKPANVQEKVQTFSENSQAQRPVVPSEQAKPATALPHHAPDPRANMMKEVSVDLSKMFNVNK
jgi:hypothetical protein